MVGGIGEKGDRKEITCSYVPVLTKFLHGKAAALTWAMLQEVSLGQRDLSRWINLDHAPKGARPWYPLTLLIPLSTLPCPPSALAHYLPGPSE